MSSSANVVPIPCSRTSCDTCSLVTQCLAWDHENDADHAYDIPVVPRIYRRKEAVFRAGDKFDAVYIVRSGAVKSYVILSNGDEQVIGFHYPGDVIGLDAVDKGVYISNTEALDTSSLCTLPYEKLSRLCMRSRAVHNRLMRSVSRRIEMDHTLLVLLGQKTADQRIAAFLLEISEVQVRLGFSPSHFTLPMSRSDIASYLSLAVETVSRVLTRLQEAGTLEVNRSQVAIVDYLQLAELAAAEDDSLATAVSH